ncbi:MAG: DUF418 domain-containing protein [Micrococcus sp.]|nr:DUF418 domain-containing protein [Micrococcus sp.]
MLAALGVAVAAAIFVAVRAGSASFLVPYQGSATEVVFNAALAVTVAAGIAVLVSTRGGHGWRVAAWAGQMSLTLYVAHQAFLGWVIHQPAELWRMQPGRDDSWLVLAVLIAGVVVLPLAWRALPLPGAWRRGPLEGASRQLERLVLR